MTDARAEIASAEAALRRARAQLTALENEERQKRYPNAPDSDLVRFNIQFSIPGTVYRYAAIKANGRWYTTGGQSFDSWNGLIDWIRKNHVGAGIYITSMEPSGNESPLRVDTH